MERKKSLIIAALSDMVIIGQQSTACSRGGGPYMAAVGTTIADRPPHRSVRARLRTRLLPRMSGGEADMRIGMQNAGLRNPPVQDGEQPPPAHLGALTATN
jgi:hypothetical protein